MYVVVVESRETLAERQDERSADRHEYEGERVASIKQVFAVFCFLCLQKARCLAVAKACR
jgi:hypothetical protein